MKTEKPTKRRIEQESKKGKSFNSRDLVVALILFGGTLCLVNWVSFAPIGELFTYPLKHRFEVSVAAFAWMALQAFARVIAPVLAVCIVCAAAVSLAQSRGVIAVEAIKIDLTKLNPITGLKNLFSIKVIKDLVKAVLYAVGTVAAGYLAWNNLAPLIYAQVHVPGGQLAAIWSSAAIQTVLLLLMCLSPVFLIGAIAEFMLYIKDLKMEKFEVKQERNDNEGRPEIKQRRRELGMELLSTQQKADISGSNMVLANPTHIAIGIFLLDESTPMPFISIREQGTRALAVIAYAESVGVPIVRDIPLARRIFAKHTRYSFISRDEIEPIMRLLQWLAEVERAGATDLPETDGG
jgi:type III secretion system export apparatus switch protein